ncbi:gamma-glutamyltransferase [Benzoatithermus flavus]|uniref:Glutathione hydrolase proenzyme n=1 Tax=Benzoatithermus flavus TaxID=3108223 RepID=A0ABU8XU02_9PROT
MKRRATMPRLIVLVAYAVLAASAGRPAQAQPAPEGASGWAEKPVSIAQSFMVVAANPLASDAGAAVLARGGSAIDAMVATQLVLNLVEPQSSGIGGGAFLLYWDAAKQRLTTFDGRETAPKAARPDLFLKPDGTPMSFLEAVVGGRSVGVPGTLALLELAHDLHGRLPWAELFQPAIDLAENGFTISPRLAGAIADTAAQGLDRSEATRAYLLQPDGQPRRAGTVLKNPAFAQSLRLIAREGAKALYRGEIGDAIVEAVQKAPVNPGLLTKEDLASYRVVLREPVCRPYRRVEVCGMGPPSSGGVAVLQILGLLEHFDMRSLGSGVDGMHVLLEASKLAFADRDLYLADDDFVPVPLRGLLDPSYLTVRAQAIRLDAAMPKAIPGNPPWREIGPLAPDTRDERPGTSQIVIVDRAGNAVSMTTTIESGFGSRLMAGGFMLNNELTDFSFQPEQNGRPVANRVEPGKRPRSSMAPTIVLDASRRPMLLIGSPGGSQIIGYVAQALVGILDWGMSPQAAVAMGHVLSRNGPAELEAGTPAAALEPALAARGHQVQVKPLNSGLHAILIGNGRLESGIDPRREGAARGQ